MFKISKVRTDQWISNVISATQLGPVEKVEKNNGPLIFSTGHLGGPNDSKSIGNQLLWYIGVRPQINLPNRVQLVSELERFEYFVGGAF